MDNLNTHTIGSLYDAFDPAEARRLAERLEIHHTLKYGSWLNSAEVELQVRSSQCLDRRIDNRDKLAREVQGWTDHRNASITGVNAVLLV